MHSMQSAAFGRIFSDYFQICFLESLFSIRFTKNIY